MESTPLRIVIDRNIPFVAKPLATLGDVIALPGGEIDAEVMRDADILLTRTRTRCDAALLEGSRCRFIGTATIGTDHIDLDRCRSRGITVANAPGCNAPAVAQWVLAAIEASGREFSDVTLGVIGAGHVGSILIRWAEGLGMKVLVNDPPLAEAGDKRHEYQSLEVLAREADVITVHTPLTKTDPHATHHLLNDEFIGSLKRKPLILNVARGPVADTGALLRGLDKGLISAVGIDCWEGEPDINPELLDRAIVATPHIAGYSFEGKVRASQMVLTALSRHLGLTEPLKADAPLLPEVPLTISSPAYDILSDTRRLKARPHDFEELRNNYNLRPEPRG